MEVRSLPALRARPTVVAVRPNRHLKRVADKAFRCLRRGTKVPGRVKAELGDFRLKRLRQLAVAEKMAAAA